MGKSLAVAWTNGAMGRSYLIHAAAIVILVLVSPTAYRLGESLSVFPPDTGAYLSLAREMAAAMRLALTDWGQTGSGVILPPLYPLAIAAATPLAGDERAAAELVSWAAALLSIVPLYLLAVRGAGVAGAVAAVAAIQWNFQFAFFALLPLTESLFVCVIDRKSVV